MIATGIFGYLCTGDIKIALWFIATYVILKSYVVKRLLGGYMFKLYYTILYFLLSLSLKLSIETGLYNLTESWHSMIRDITKIMFIMSGTHT